MTKPAVSIIIPAYNAARYISETIRSVQEQSFTNWELIIVDDGSKDQTAEIVKSFLHDVRIKFLQQENAGVSAARNFGFENSSGDYLAFLDADDVWLPDNLLKKKEWLDKNPEVGIVFSDVENIDADSKRTGFINRGKEGNLVTSLLLWDGTTVPGPSTILVRRIIFQKAGKFDTSFSTAADQDFFFRVAEFSTFGRLQEPLSLYRVHDLNMHHNIERMERDHILVYKKAAARGAFKSWAFKKKCFSSLYLILAGSWWVNGKNKKRGMLFMWKSVVCWPPNIFKLFKKIF